MTTAAAQDSVPSLTGARKGTGKILLYGATKHLSGSAQNAVVRDLEVTTGSRVRTANKSCLLFASTSAIRTLAQARLPAYPSTSWKRSAFPVARSALIASRRFWRKTLLAALRGRLSIVR
jgi:hypothetical protein